MVNRIETTFRELKRAKRKALIGYVTAGFPTKASLRILVPLLEESGADLLELGVPFSDPIADGPTIQHSSQMALQNGTTLQWVLESVRQLRRDGVKLPLILMSYCNPIHAMGIDRFFLKAAQCGVDGLIIPDMIPEEADVYSRLAKKNKVDLIFLVAPTTPKSRIRRVAQKTQGFLYAVSITGVTGVHKAIPADVGRFLKLVKSSSKKPVAVGFGITKPEQAQQIAQYADGVIVGSELIRQIEKSKHTSFQGAAVFIQSLRRALDHKETNHASSSPRTKKAIPAGVWTKCDKCEQIIYNKELEENFKICPKCGAHFRLNARERVKQLFDEGSFKEFGESVHPMDPLGFVDIQPYSVRLTQSQKKTGQTDACVAGEGTIDGHALVAALLDFDFMGGSMGSVVGEKVTLAIEKAVKERVPLLLVSASGGARMQESILSLMQMAKTSAALARLHEAQVPFISLLTDPTTGGVTASFAMLGDLIVAEPKALIAFAGPRVIEQTIREQLPEGFQLSEFLLSHGMIDAIVERKDLKKFLADILVYFKAGVK